MRKQFLKKAVTVMLAGAMALSLTACGGGDKKDDSKKNESKFPNKKPTVSPQQLA